MYDFDATPTEKHLALPFAAVDAPLQGLTLRRGEPVRDGRGLFRGEFVLQGVLNRRPVEFVLDERTSTITFVDGLRVRELSSRELAALRRAVQSWLERLGGGDFAGSTFLVHLNELVFGRPVLAHFVPTLASERPGEALTLSGSLGKASLVFTLTRGGRLTLTWKPRGCETARSRRLTSSEAATLVQVLGARVQGEPRTLLDEAVARVWEAARSALH